MWSYTSVRSTIRIRTVFFITKILSVYVTQIRTTGGFFFIYLITYHYITVCKNGYKKRVLTKLIARTRFSDFDYLFSEINVNLSVILYFYSIYDKINCHKSDTLRWSGAKLVHYFQR
jgi:hypothetical protein